MTMNPRQYLVLIKGRDRTNDIWRIAPEAGRTAVTFKGGESYHYDRNNVELLSNPESIPVQHCRCFIEEEMFPDVEEVLRFGKWTKVFLGRGGSRCCLSSALSVRQMKAPDGRSRDVLAYFRELAEGADLRTNSGDSLLAMKYRILDTLSHPSILTGFLHDRSPGAEWVLSESTSRLIFPFGCNMSQKEAVLKALQNPVSLIQGPPGTGKTQTILNLIANLLLQKKRVAVVSNNNSATANVLDKLKKYDLDFAAAFLGSAENKKSFIEEQKIEPLRLPTLGDGEEKSVEGRILHLNRDLDHAFKTKNELAAVIQQISAFRLELSHFERFRRETGNTGSDAGEGRLPPKLRAEKLLEYWLAWEPKARSHADSNAPFPSPEGLFPEPSKIRYFEGFLKRYAVYLKKILFLLRFGLPALFLLKLGAEDIIPVLQKAYYRRKIEELEAMRNSLEASLREFRFDESLEHLTGLSMQLLKHRLADRYNGKTRCRFSLEDLWKKPEKFLEEYPVILSTTFSVISSVQNGYLFDCVIVDEASQVDMLSGVLAMGCAKTLVIVGDPMQLPNVLTEQDMHRAMKAEARYEVPEYARFDRHNLLSSVRAAFPGIPETLLREHYRCHPKIIGFCNQKYYRGELLVMTHDQGEPDVLKAYVTVAGNHARGNFNQRQIDEIDQHVLREFGSFDPSDIGIISPYRMQAEKARASMGFNGFEIDTVHKYQGREKRIIIITTVSNETNGFVDDPNLLNVAISRAQEKLRLVVSSEMAGGRGNIPDFVRYIRYMNCEVTPGRVRSIFDLLYGQYSEARMKALKNRKRISAFDSENLIHGEIESVLGEKAYLGYGVVCQFPLSMLVNSTGHLTAREVSYAAHPWTKTDFLIYRKIDKIPVLAIEVDGYGGHKEGTLQAARDALKDSVLRKCGLPILRMSTVGSNERNRIRDKLLDAMGPQTGP